MGPIQTICIDALHIADMVALGWLDPAANDPEADIMSQAPGFPCASLNGTGTGDAA
jgi:hypothetical protein